MSLPPQQFCVRWNSYHTNLQTVFPKLLSTENFVDVTLACENRQIKCHKVVLSACSTYFERLLIQNPCKHPIIFMKDMRFSEMQSLVDFMYKGEVNVSQDDLPSLLKSAEALQIRGLCGSDSGGASSAGDNSQETNDSRSTSNQMRETSPQHPTELHKEISKPINISEQPNQNCVPNDTTHHNSTSAPLSNSSKKRRDQGTSPELLAECRGTRKSGDLSFKEEMVEEDGLFYGEMENEDGDCGDQIDDEVLPNSSTGGQQSSGFTKKKKNIPTMSNDIDDPIITKLQQCSRLSIKMCNDSTKTKQNHLNNNNGLMVADNKTNSSNEPITSLIISDESEIDNLIYENEDYLKQWLLKNHELEVSLSSIDPNPNSKYKSRLGYRKNNMSNLKSLPTLSHTDVMDEKNWLQNFHDHIDVKDGIIKSVDKSLKRKMKSAGIEEMAAFLEPSDLDQFLAGKEVSSSGISRKAIEQAMMGKYNPNRRYSNQAMWAALMDVKKGGSIYRAAQTHKVPRKSLRNWMKRWHIKSSFPMPQQLKQFVENNRKHKIELRREFTNTLLSLGSRLSPQKVAEKYLESADDLFGNNVEGMDHEQDEEEPAKKDQLDCAQIIDMSGNVLYDEDIASVTMSSQRHTSSISSRDVEAQKNTSLVIKKQILFSDVEQLAGLDQPKSDGNASNV